MPDCPSEQKPSRPPMSPIPGTEQMPPPAGAVADSVLAGIAVSPPVAGAAAASSLRGVIAAPVFAGAALADTPCGTLSTAITAINATAILRGSRRSLGIGGLLGFSSATFSRAVAQDWIRMSGSAHAPPSTPSGQNLALPGRDLAPRCHADQWRPGQPPPSQADPHAPPRVPRFWPAAAREPD